MGVKDEAGRPALGQKQPVNAASSLARHQAKHCSQEGPDAGISGSPGPAKGSAGQAFHSNPIAEECPVHHFASHLVGQRIFVYFLHGHQSYLEHKIPLFAVVLTVDEPKHLQIAFLSQPTIPGPLSTILISLRDPGLQLQPHTKSHLQTRPRFLCSKPFSFHPLRPDRSSPTPMLAAAAKSLQSCPTLCDPIDGSPPGSPVPGLL